MVAAAYHPNPSQDKRREQSIPTGVLPKSRELAGAYLSPFRETAFYLHGPSGVTLPPGRLSFGAV